MGRPRIALVAGEASGDLLGAGLVRALRSRYPEAEFVGMAGPAMVAAGVAPWWRSEEIGNGPAKTEAARMEAAAEAAGKRWDEWHEGALALVEGILAGEEIPPPTNPVTSVNPDARASAAASAPPRRPR